jgi:hypothetical protein
MAAHARELIWISVRGLTKAQLGAILLWQEGHLALPHRDAGGSCGCPEDGRGFYSGAYTRERAERFKAYLLREGIKVQGA